MIKYLIIGVVCGITCISNSGFSYSFGLKSFDNTVDNILEIEEQYKLHVPVVSFIFDPRGPWVIERMHEIGYRMGNDRVFHITISPPGSADDVASGGFDEQYRQVFRIIKQYDMKVLFRTMHEMNGGRYPRGSDPESFKRAWIHVWKLAREEGLDTHNILFIMSINHWDAPTIGTPSKTAPLVFCTPKKKTQSDCHVFEDYYPGDEYVDLMGVTFYNRGQAIGSRRWLTPKQIMYDKQWDTMNRLKKMGKPIFIDEVATTAVRYTQPYDPAVSQHMYNNVWTHKNTWLTQLRRFLQEESNHIVGAIYFNIDYTNGLTSSIIGEADWAVIKTHKDKIYFGVYDLFKYGQDNRKNNKLLALFGRRVIEKDGVFYYVPASQEKRIRDMLSIIQRNTKTNEDAVLLIDIIQKKLAEYIPEPQQTMMNEILAHTRKMFVADTFVF